MKKIVLLTTVFLLGVAAAAPQDIISAGRKDGKLNTIALPSDWANYGEIMSTFEKKYNIKITNASPQASSAEELQAVRSLKGQNRAPDVLDIGPGFAVQAKQEGLIKAYKPATWNSIPADAKDPDGAWMGNYFGVVSIGVNRDRVKNPPKSFKDLLKPEYRGMIALSGDPLTGQSPFSAVWAAALANGGSFNNIQPGIDFFQRLKASGNYIPVQGTPAAVQSGQVAILIDWDYLNIGYSKALKGKVNYEVIIPSDAVFGNHYATAVSAYAPNPNAAKLWMEFIASDEGQMLFLKGFARPIRFNDMMRRGVIPKSMLEGLPDAAMYAKVRFPNNSQTEKARGVMRANWTKQLR